MKKSLFVAAVFAAFMSVSVAHAAIYVKMPDVGGDVAISIGTAFVLDGSRSQDDGVVQRFLWKQTSGPTVEIMNSTSAKASFTPKVAGTYEFELTVTDASGVSSVEGTVKVVVPDDSASAAGKSKGNVEYTWKVEEGQKGGPALLEIDGVKGESTDKKGKESGEKGGTEDINIGVGEQAKVNKVDAITIKQSMKGGVSVAAGDVDGLTEEEKKEFLAKVKAHAQVKSEQDLENFAKGILLKDENVEEVSADEDSVAVRYRVPAKFLGFFETTLPVEVVAEKAQGELGGGVKVKFPWFRFLFGVPDDVSEDSLETDVEAAVTADLDRDGELDVVVVARLYNAISNVLKTKHDTAKNSIGNIR